MALRKGIALSFGLMACNVSIHSGIEKASASGNKLVCTGSFQGVDRVTGNPKSHPEHPPNPISQVMTCRSCDDVVPYTSLKKGRPEGDGFVLLTADELTTAAADSLDLKKKSALTPHPTTQVDLATVPGEKFYYLTPEAGGEASYASMRHLVESHPELTFMSLWTPSSRAAQFALKVKDDCLVWQERVRQENIREAPVVDVEAPEPMLKMAEQVLGLEGIVTDYDPTTYEDTYETKLAEILATKTAVPGQTQIEVAGVTTPSTAVAGMDALAAMLANAEASGRKPAAKKAAKPRKKAA